MGEVKPEPAKSGEVKPEPIQSAEVKPEPTLVITGANGFLGQACVIQARRRGLAVVAVSRGPALAEWEGDPQITHLRLDLSEDSSPATLAKACPNHCAIIQTAGPMSGAPLDLARQTLQIQASVWGGRRDCDVPLVLISSLSVYDTDQLSPGDALTENSPLLSLPPTPLVDPRAIAAQARDAYAGAKRAAEFWISEQVRMAPEQGRNLWILRPGAIWGPGRSWHALMGFFASKLHITIGSEGELPLCHVDHVAGSAVDAALTPTDTPQMLNVFDDDRPTRARFRAAHRRCYGWPRLNVTVPYGAWLGLVRLLAPVAQKLPGLFREPILRARMMPLRFPNTALRSALGGEDFDTFEGMMARTRDEEPQS